METKAKEPFSKPAARQGLEFGCAGAGEAVQCPQPCVMERGGGTRGSPSVGHGHSSAAKLPSIHPVDGRRL